MGGGVRVWGVIVRAKDESWDCGGGIDDGSRCVGNGAWVGGGVEGGGGGRVIGWRGYRTDMR